MIGSLLFAAGLALSSAQPTPAVLYPRAQALVEREAAAHPELLNVLMHVTPPKLPENIVVAARIAKNIGENSSDDDLGVMRTGQPIVEVQADGVRIGVLVQLRDAAGRPIGALGLMYAYHVGDDQKAVLRRSLMIRDQMARAIPSKAALFKGS